MLSHIQGTISERLPSCVSLMTHSGVGYEIFVPTSLLGDIGETVLLYVSLIVRDDAHTLYGFTTSKEKDLFRLLISVSGVGPKSALTLLSLADYETLLHAIAHGDVAFLQKTPGIGKKSAQKLIVELQDKLSQYQQNTYRANVRDEEALAALVSLGYSKKDSEHILDQVEEEYVTTQARVRRALQLLSQ